MAWYTFLCHSATETDVWKGGDFVQGDMQVLLEAMENGMIDVAEIREKVEMARRQAILEKHPYKITRTKDGQWTTHYMEGGVRRQIKRKSKRVVENILVRYYKNLEDNPTLDELFTKVQREKLAYDHKKEATISRNQREYDRFFQEFGKRRIKDIDDLDIENFLRKCRREKDLSKRSFRYLTSILRMIFNEALIERYIDYDIEPVIKRSRGQQKSSFRVVRKEDSEEVYSADEITALEEVLLCDGSIHALGVELLIQSGMRIGEAVALTWSDYDPEKHSLHIHRTETTYSTEGKVKVEISESPKTDAGNRVFPVFPEMQETLDRIRRINPDSEYILSYHGSRIRAEKIRKKLKNTCESCGIDYRSPHKLRKTFASRLAAVGVPPRIITELLGHEDYQVTQNYYIKRFATLDQKENYLREAMKKTVPQA